MSDDLTELRFTLSDKIGKEPITSKTVSLPVLRSFMEEVEKLIRGNASPSELSNSHVLIEDGSVELVTFVASLLALDAERDFQRLQETGDLDSIQPQRAEIIERWQSRAKKNHNIEYTFGSARTQGKLRVYQNSNFSHRDENSWVNVEKYLVGKVVDIGGKSIPNIHLVLAQDGQNVRINATEDQLASENENKLYRKITVRVNAEQHLQTQKLRKIQFIEFVQQSSDIDEEALVLLWEKGRESWKNVESTSEWVSSLRGVG